MAIFDIIVDLVNYSFENGDLDAGDIEDLISLLQEIQEEMGGGDSEN